MVVQGVPASIGTGAAGEAERFFDRGVARRLEELTRNKLLEDPTTGKVHIISWSDQAVQPSADVEVRVRGPNISYGTASLKVWRSALDRVAAAYRTVAGSIAEAQGLGLKELPSPTVAYAGSGSLVIGLRADPQAGLFPGIPRDLAFEALKTIVEASEWVSSDMTSAPPFGDPNLADAVLEAVAELAPSRQEEGLFVEIVPYYREARERFAGKVRAIRLTPETRRRVASLRVQIALEDGEARQITLRGIISSISIDGVFHMREVKSLVPNWVAKTARWEYPESLLSELVRYFPERKPVTVSGVQKRVGKKWSGKLRALEILPEDASASVTLQKQ